jgi:hypothetical protein
MSEFCYVIVNNAGHSWSALGSANGNPTQDQIPPVLPELLQEGWVPVRETPMGGGTSHLAHSLILLERGVTRRAARLARRAARRAR